MTYKNLFIFYFLCAAILAPLPSLAEENLNDEQAPYDEELSMSLINHVSVTGIFEVHFPHKYKYKIFPFQINNETIAFSSEIISSFVADPRGNSKSLIVRTVNTLGVPIPIENAKEILSIAAGKYEKLAQETGAEIIENVEIDRQGFPGIRLIIVYKQAEDQVEGATFRINIFLTNYALVEQVITGPSSRIYSYQSESFFDSLKLFDGITKEKAPLGTGWKETTSAQKTFSVKLPPKNKEYTPYDPAVSSDNSSDRLSFQISDPVLQKNLFYRVTVYKTNAQQNLKAIDSILTKNHVSKFISLAKPGNIKYFRVKKETGDALIAKLIINPITQYPDVNALYYEILTDKNFLMVKEFWGNSLYDETKIYNTFFDLTTFHPEQYTPVPPQKSE